MGTQYWDMMVITRFRIIYCEKYEHYLRVIDGWLTFIPMVITALTIAAWSSIPERITLWVFIIALAQVVQLIKPMLPYSQRMTAIHFYLPELRTLAVAFEYRWNCQDECSIGELAVALRDDKLRFVDLETKFIGSETIPGVKKLRNIAMDEAEQYMESFEVPKKGGETDASKEPPIA